MASNVTRIAAPAGSGRTRYVGNRVISALFRDVAVLLVSLSPEEDLYSDQVANLRGVAHYPDCDIIPGEPGALGANLTYLCWASGHGQSGADYEHLVGHLRVDPGSVLRPLSWCKKTLLVLDGCQYLEREPVAAHAATIRDFAVKCAAAGHQVVAIGESDADTAWLDSYHPAAVISPDLGQSFEAGLGQAEAPSSVSNLAA